MKSFLCLVLGTMVLTGAGHSAEPQPKIKRLNDTDFLLLLKTTPAESETLLPRMQAKFYRAVKDSACLGANGPVVAYLFFTTTGDCTAQQLIRLPESLRWELNIWKHTDENRVSAHLVREYVKNNVPVIEEWEVSGNGKEYNIYRKGGD